MLAGVVLFLRSDSSMSRKGIGDRMKAKTNVATVRLASALGFQVIIEWFVVKIKLIFTRLRETWLSLTSP